MINKKVDEIVSKMTLKEKLPQLYMTWGDPKNDPDFASVMADGLALTYPQKGDHKKVIDFIDRLSRRYIEKSRFDIPPMFIAVGVHGLGHPLGTQFPIPIAMAGTFDTDLLERIFSATAREARSLGISLVFGSVLDVARDPRWGRLEETYGEDPYLVGELGVAAVKGLRGEGETIDDEHVAVILRHFCGYGEPLGGLNCRPLISAGERDFRTIHLYPFKQVLQRTKVSSVMPSYNEIDGVPSHANKWLLQDILREEIGFDGFVISDADGVRRLVWDQKVAPDFFTAAETAFNAGVDIELFKPYTYRDLEKLIEQGRISEDVITERIKPIIRTKIELGLLEYKKPDVAKAKKVLGCKEHKKLALEAARKSIVMLKNEKSMAPVDINDIKKVAMIGPNIKPVRLGGYSGKGYYVNILDGIKNRVGDEVEVLYAEGCKIPKPGEKSKFDMAGTIGDKKTSEDSNASAGNLITKAKDIAAKSDLVVLGIGWTEYTTREAWNHHWGDNYNFKIIGDQVKLIKEIAALNKPVIAVIIGGNPSTDAELYDLIPTIYQCWYLGSETGNAIADVIFGNYNPSGKLAVSIPRSVGHLPCFYNFKPAPVSVKGDLFKFGKKQPYNYEKDNLPLFPFGYGLSYTSFDIKAKLEKNKISPKETVKVYVTVKNTGEMAGDEVVQLYIRDMFSSVTRPIKELKDFCRVSLEAKEQKTVCLEITPEKLSFYDVNMNYTVEKGEFEIYVGNSSKDEDLQTLKLKVN